MKSYLWLLLAACLCVLVACKSINQSINHEAPATDFSQADLGDGAPPPDPKPAEEEDEENLVLPEAKDYPMILYIDPQKPEMEAREVIFPIIGSELSRVFSVYDAVAKEESIRQELRQSGQSAVDIPEDYLFKKFNEADLCVYIWCTIQERPSPMHGNNICFYWVTIGSRILDTITKKVLVDIPPISGKRGGMVGREVDRNKAVEEVAQKVAKELLKRVDNVISNFKESTYHIKGTLASDKDRQKLASVLESLQHDGELKIKSTQSDSALFDYVIFCSNKSNSDLAALIKEAADVEENLKIKVRVARRLINISKP